MLFPFSWSSDGKILILEEYIASDLLFDIGMLSMEGDRERTSLLQEEHYEFFPQISPDGNWLAYTSNESGRLEIYVNPFPDVKKRKWRISTNGGSDPLWSPDGRELFYRNGDEVVAVPVETKPTFKHGKPEILFRGVYASSYINIGVPEYTPWDIHPNDGRFLMLKTYAPSTEASTTETPTKITIVLNWFEELRERIPID